MKLNIAPNFMRPNLYNRIEFLHSSCELLNMSSFGSTTSCEKMLPIIYTFSASELLHCICILIGVLVNVNEE